MSLLCLSVSAFKLAVSTCTVKCFADSFAVDLHMYTHQCCVSLLLILLSLSACLPLFLSICLSVYLSLSLSLPPAPITNIHSISCDQTPFHAFHCQVIESHTVAYHSCKPPTLPHTESIKKVLHTQTSAVFMDLDSVSQPHKLSNPLSRKHYTPSSKTKQKNWHYDGIHKYTPSTRTRSSNLSGPPRTVSGSNSK